MLINRIFSLEYDDVKKKKMYVTIHDTSVGMSKETLEEVFDKFVRAKNANSVNVTGTGLGLFVAKKMVDSMGGKVWAESDGEGQGIFLRKLFRLFDIFCKILNNLLRDQIFKECNDYEN